MGERKSITVQLSPGLHKRLKVAAARAEISMATLIRQLLIRWVEDQEEKYSKP